MKAYTQPDFKFLDMVSEHQILGASQPASEWGDSGNISPGEGEQEESDAPIFRPGIWDNDQL